MDSGELLDWLTLSFVPGLGPSGGRRLVEHFGSPGRALAASAAELQQVARGRPGWAKNFAAQRRRTEDRAAAELTACGRAGVAILPLTDPAYPELLKHIPDPPLLLFVKGVAAVLNAPAVAIVGSRASSSYGRRVAAQFGTALAEHGLVVTSGLALGIDSEAHAGALAAAGGRTVAVLGCGLDQIYPRENLQFFRKIPDSGALVSEYPLGTRPESFRFPARNRIISGLSLGVVVVEATRRSGSLITARHALEQGREVFAVPGQVDSIKSAGAHGLLQEGAKLVQSVADILEELPLAAIQTGNEPGGRKETAPDHALGSEEATLFGLLEVYPRHVDDLVHLSGLSAQRVSEFLLLLELKGLVESQPGNLFRRL